MAAHDAVKFQRLRVERNEAEIAGRPNDGAADRVGEHAADIEGFGDEHYDQRRQQRKAGQEDEAEAEQDIDRALVDRPAAEIGRASCRERV